jgi:hypothetical protein
MTRPPPACDWFMIHRNAPMISTIGMSWNRNPTSAEPFCGSISVCTPASCN